VEGGSRDFVQGTFLVWAIPQQIALQKVLILTM